ncbi:S1 RNA-binding domain-containing protein [Actinocrispum sp. NPDC049592]|uniref:S1 RNA-binding domain-containing protein n=1 Tax=Actinocrispum sp. NPDC049592 TaxID=3154835 RepID=UPI003443CB08
MTEAPDFSKFAAEHAAGDVLSGRVAEVVSFGSFVELEGGVHGLLHGQQLDRDMAVRVQILEIDAVKQRTSLKLA